MTPRSVTRHSAFGASSSSRRICDVRTQSCASPVARLVDAERVVAHDLAGELDRAAGALDDAREGERGGRLADAVRADEGDLGVAGPGHRADAIASRRLRFVRPVRPPHDELRLLDDARQVRLVDERLGVELRDVLGARWARREPATLGDDLQAADGRAVARRPREPATIGSPASWVAPTCVGRERPRAAFWRGVAGASMRR